MYYYRNNQDGGYFIASMKIPFGFHLCGKKIYYKYLVNCSSFPCQELIYIFRPKKQEVYSCYRITTLPVMSK